VELKLQPTESAPRNVVAERGEELCRRAAHGRGAVAEMCTRLESGKKKLTREDLQELLSWCREAFADALFLLYGREAPEERRTLARYLAGNLDKKRISAALDAFGRYYRDCNTAVGVGHVLGALAAELEGL
jgi:hypothetical protein